MTNITISPLNKVLRLESNSTYEDTVDITNEGDDELSFELYATPYSYEQKTSTNKETPSTQIAKWITFKSTDGSYQENPVFDAKPHQTITVSYRVSTPNAIPANDQYAVIFARTIVEKESGSGVRTTISPGMIIYGHSDEAVTLQDGTYILDVIFSPAVLIPAFLLLTILSIWIIIAIRKRKERRDGAR